MEARCNGFLFCSKWNQFGFKPKYGSDMCISVLKEILDFYNKRNSTVFVGSIDASKAFNRINHEKLFLKLQYRGGPQVPN